ncbi:lactate/malate dehydrogenase family protein [Neorhodopirellula pilleata]|uniref:L-lactate dehydrogenase n=1 Tax=Neorhodopirellula pilleata TaxID=2714738 RepID=A0A5C5ZXZ5_9BACT|nr:lactate/malate dehydrogenase family protein [Neorhodopirellula pilleata]TWT92149.1 L-lactate dehydrogenase [Neorhodopirellula pilleata]
MKVSIIGGGGLVGSCAAYALQCGGLANEIALLDVNEELAVGHALDLQHGSPSIANQVFAGGGYEHIPTSDIICITAGLRRKPDESRLDLINRNTDLFVEILRNVKAAGPKPTAIVLVVSNPVDILTYVAADMLGLPQQQVIGLGTQLDTIRFCSLIAQELGAPPTQTKALILGEHGETMVPIWSSATIAGLPLDKYPGWNPNLAGALFTRTRGSGAEVIKRKGGAGFAVGVAIRDCIDAIILDTHSVLPVSSIQNGCYGIRDVALSVPTVLGRTGVQATMEIDLWPKEVQGLRQSGAALRKTLDTVMQRVG